MHWLRTTVLLCPLPFAVACAGVPDAGSEIRLRVMSYNVKHGQAMTRRPIRANLEVQAAILREQRPDLIGLQEIDQGCKRSHGLDETGLFETMTGMNGAFGKFMDYDGGEYGLALLSRFPTSKVETVALPPGRHEPRVALLHNFEVRAGLSVVFVNVHFDWLRESKERVRQAEALMDRLADVDLPVIVIGDYNARPGSQTLQVFSRAGFELVPKEGSRYTFNSVTPSKEIDHVCVRGSSKYKIRAAGIKVIDERVASDHRPIVTDVYITPRQ